MPGNPARSPRKAQREKRMGKPQWNLCSFRLNGNGRTGRVRGDIGGMGLPMGNERFLPEFEIEQP